MTEKNFCEHYEFVMDYLVAVLLCTHCQNMFALYATHFKSKYLCFKLYFK